ncbi:MAG: PH domain-containing protein, partial [bacterium]
AYMITMYVMDIWIVTNMRIIDSTQQGFFNRTVSEISLGNIQDISTMISGLIPTTMNYGDVEVQSAGAVDHFKFRQVPNPLRVKEVISKALADYKHSHFKDEALEVVKEVEEAKDKLSHKEEPVPENLPQ